jgi:hypothetical protein
MAKKGMLEWTMIQYNEETFIKLFIYVFCLISI